MKIRLRKNIIFICMIMLMLAYSTGCSKKADSDKQEAGNGNVAEEVNAVTDAAEMNLTEIEEAKNVETVIELSNEKQAEEKEQVIVEGYDITEATSGTRLMDAYAKYFSLGCAINGSQPGNATVKSEAMSEILTYHFNSTTFSNLMKPSYLLDQQGSVKNYKDGNDMPAVNFNSIKDGMEFARDNNIKMRGHVLVWHEQAPDWFFREGYDSSADFVDKDTMLVRMESYIKQVLEFTQLEYPGVIYCWDVVNEAVENSPGLYEMESGFKIRKKFHSGENPWYKTIGVDYVEKAFEYARKYADPSVKLFYNDYNTFQPVKTQSIYDLVAYLKTKGLVDGIGMQGYMDLSYPGIRSGTDNVKKAIEKFAELGLEIQLTELTIRSKDKEEKSFQRQGDRYKELFELLIELDQEGGGPANITNVTFFAIMDDYHFYKGNNNNPEYHRLFDGDLQPKPAFYSVLSVVEIR